MVKTAWNRGKHRVPVSLENVHKDALNFNEKTFGNIFKRKRSLESHLNGIQKVIENFDATGITVFKQEELLWYQM